GKSPVPTVLGSYFEWLRALSASQATVKLLNNCEFHDCASQLMDSLGSVGTPEYQTGKWWLGLLNECQESYGAACKALHGLVQPPWLDAIVHAPKTFAPLTLRGSVSTGSTTRTLVAGLPGQPVNIQVDVDLYGVKGPPPTLGIGGADAYRPNVS